MSHFREFFAAHYEASVDSILDACELEKSLRKSLLHTSDDFTCIIEKASFQVLKANTSKNNRPFYRHTAKWLNTVAAKRDQYGRTFLHCAVALGHTHTVLYLMPRCNASASAMDAHYRDHHNLAEERSGNGAAIDYNRGCYEAEEKPF